MILRQNFFAGLRPAPPGSATLTVTLMPTPSGPPVDVQGVEGALGEWL
jgi:hypothetical protein